MRQPKNNKSLAREKSKRLPFPRILIICEGKKTEPNYFKNIKRRHKLSSTYISIAKNDCGSAPVSIVECAKKLCKEENADEVYCVFDRDDHVSFKAAVNQLYLLNSSKKWPIFEAIFSDPCFELWVILHFKFSSKQYRSNSCKSKCDQVIKDLKAHLPGYQKENSDLYDILYLKYETAIDNARKLEAHHKCSGTTDPCTNIYKLVDRLRNFRK